VTDPLTAGTKALNEDELCRKKVRSAPLFGRVFPNGILLV